MLPAPVANTEEVSAQKVKALMILQMHKFLAIGNPARPVQSFCYYEEDLIPAAESVGQIIAAAVKANPEKIKLRVKRHEATNSFADCDLLYIPDTAENNLSNVLSATAGLPIITISATKRFIYRGGMIGFVVDNQNHIKIEANIRNMTDHKVQIDPQLLEIMVHVEN